MKDDPLFGRLSFVEVKAPGASFWEGSGRFNPTASDVALLIAADDVGPGESHRAVYRNIERRYGELLRLVTPMLHREYAKQMQSFDVSPRQPQFTLDIVHVPEAESESMEWSLAFSCDQWDDALFTVHMKGWHPMGNISVMD